MRTGEERARPLHVPAGIRGDTPIGQIMAEAESGGNIIDISSQTAIPGNDGRSLRPSVAVKSGLNHIACCRLGREGPSHFTLFPARSAHVARE